MKKWIYRIAWLACMAVFLFSAIQLVDIYREYRAAENFYDEAAGSFTEQNTEPVEGPDPERISPPITVDFTDILKINEDVIGWIYMEDTVVSYPVLQGENNFYYLDKTYWKKYLASGSIYLDAGNDRLMGDSHSIIYGHNMKNHTMFGDLSDFRKAEYLESHPYVDLFLVDGTWLRYEIFSVYKADVYDGTFSVPLNSEADMENLLRISAEKNLHKAADGADGGDGADDSGWKLPVPDGASDKVLTLSTCTEDSADQYRFVVQAVLFLEDGLPVKK